MLEETKAFCILLKFTLSYIEIHGYLYVESGPFQDPMYISASYVRALGQIFSSPIFKQVDTRLFSRQMVRFSRRWNKIYYK